MSKYLFILGKNWILSIAELIVHLENQGLAANIVDHSKSVAVLEIDEKLSDEKLVDIQSFLGGCFKTARQIAFYEKRIATKAFPRRGKIIQKHRKKMRDCPWSKQIWTNPKKKKIKFGISTYPSGGKDNIDFKRFTFGMDEYLKRKLLEEGARKVAFVAYEEPDRRQPARSNTALWPQTIARHNLLSPPNAEILAAFTFDNLYLGKTVAVYDSMLQQYRDEARPYVSSEISTSPKLCRTLINLAGAKRGDTLLDPFCGSGTLLMEAAMLGIECIGMDIDGNAVQGATSNMKWLGSQLEQNLKFTILREDAREASKHIAHIVDAIAFEPDLGPTHSSRPSLVEGKQTMEDLSDLYRSTLHSLSDLLRNQGRIAMTLPVLLTRNGILNIDIDEIIGDSRLVVFPMLPAGAFSEKSADGHQEPVRPNRRVLPERKRGQIVQRDVLVLEKV